MQLEQCQNLVHQHFKAMAECLNPFMVKDEYGHQQPVPCGKCPTCYARRASSWSFRLMEHEKTVISSHFITLTYAPKHVPITDKHFMSLNKRDVQLFIKRLRKRHNIPEHPIRYFAVGEYGGKSYRPHYHIILFNADINTISDSWNLGDVHFGSVSGASIGYCLKYISKPKRIPVHANDDRQKEFALMSKGLGLNYLTDKIKKWHLDDP